MQASTAKNKVIKASQASIIERQARIEAIKQDLAYVERLVAKYRNDLSQEYVNIAKLESSVAFLCGYQL